MKSVHANPPEKICRLCLSDSGVILPIFEGEVAERFSVPLPQKILSCLAIKVCADDPLPPHICHRCLFEVDRFHEFRETCKRTNTTFNKICNNSGENVPFDVTQVLEIKQELHDESVYHDAISDLLSDDEGTETGSSRLRKRNRCLSLLESMKRVQQAQSAASASSSHTDQLPSEWMEQTKTTPPRDSAVNRAHINTPLECRFCAKPFIYESSLLEHEELHAKGVVGEDESIEHVEQLEQHSEPLIPVSTPAATSVLTSASTTAPTPSTPHSPASAPAPAPSPAPISIAVAAPASPPSPSSDPSLPASTPILPVANTTPTSTPNQVIQQTIETQDLHETHLVQSQEAEANALPESHVEHAVDSVSLTDVTAMLLEGAFEGVRPIVGQASSLCRYCQEHFSNPDLLRRHERVYCNRKPSLMKHKHSMHQQQQQIQQHPQNSQQPSAIALAADEQRSHHLVVNQQHQAQVPAQAQAQVQVQAQAQAQVQAQTQGHQGSGHQSQEPLPQLSEQQITFTQRVVVVETSSMESARSCKHCRKDFIHRGSLWRHQNSCDANPQRDLNRMGTGNKRKSIVGKNSNVRRNFEQQMMTEVPVNNSSTNVAGTQLRRSAMPTSSGPFQCKFCEKRFLHRGSWWRHQKMFCSVNPDIPTVKAEAKVRNNQGAPNFTCRYCDRTFLHRGSCWHHEQTHTGIKEHACRYCSKTFNERSRLARHERMHQGIKPFSCQQCGKAFCDASNLRNHEQIHGERAAFLCAWCGKSYTRRALLLKHEQVHAGEGEIYQCVSCPRTFPDPETLSDHSMSHGQERRRLYLCQTCGQAFRSQSLMSQHSQQAHQHVQHTSLRQSQHIQQSTPNTQAHQGQESVHHSCNICNEAFSDATSLQNHELLHSNGPRIYHCPNSGCDAIFHQQSQLDAHLLMHEGEEIHSVSPSITSSNSSGFHQQQQQHSHPQQQQQRQPQQQQLLSAHDITHQQTLQHHELLHGEGTYVIEGQTGPVAVQHLVAQIPQ